MKCDVWDIRVEEYGIRDAKISMRVPKNALASLSADDKGLEVTIGKKRKKRSLNANAYCWVLCDKIAETLNDGSTKEDIYRRAIEAVGKFEPLCVRPAVVSEAVSQWGANGLGWICKDTGQDISGMRLLFAYYGSSAYSSAEMARLINWLVDDAEQIGCTDILTPAERSLLIEEWGA